MALEQNVRPLSFVASGDLSADQYKIVTQGTTDSEVSLCNATDNPIGVLVNKPSAAGQVAEVVTAGITPCVAGGTVTAGDKIASDADSKGVTATAATANTTSGAISGSLCIGTAKTGAAAGELFELVVGIPTGLVI